MALLLIFIKLGLILQVDRMDNNIITHLIFIPCIIFLLYAVYAAWFKDSGKKHRERGGKYLPFVPEDLKSYVQNYKMMTLITLLSMITLYILILIGVIQ
jgi:hypothetical protein